MEIINTQPGHLHCGPSLEQSNSDASFFLFISPSAQDTFSCGSLPRMDLMRAHTFHMIFTGIDCPGPCHSFFPTNKIPLRLGIFICVHCLFTIFIGLVPSSCYYSFDSQALFTWDDSNTTSETSPCIFF